MGGIKKRPRVKQQFILGNFWPDCVTISRPQSISATRLFRTTWILFSSYRLDFDLHFERSPPEISPSANTAVKGIGLLGNHPDFPGGIVFTDSRRRRDSGYSIANDNVLHKLLLASWIMSGRLFF
jgi:hypothetical protein